MKLKRYVILIGGVSSVVGLIITVISIVNSRGYDTRSRAATTGTLNACKVIMRGTDVVTDWSTVPVSTFSVEFGSKGISETSNDGTTTVSGYHPTLDTVVFETSDQPIAQSNIGGAFGVCSPPIPITFDDGKYINITYKEEVISGDPSQTSQWLDTKYTDGHTVALQLSSVTNYSPELFDTDLSNDQQRNTNSDGHIPVGGTGIKQNRTLLIVNYLPTIAPTSIPTNTPVPTITNTPIPTSTEAPTITPIRTPTPTIFVGPQCLEIKIYLEGQEITNPSILQPGQTIELVVKGGELSEKANLYINDLGRIEVTTKNTAGEFVYMYTIPLNTTNMSIRAEL